LDDSLTSRLSSKGKYDIHVVRIEVRGRLDSFSCLIHICFKSNIGVLQIEILASDLSNRSARELAKNYSTLFGLAILTHSTIFDLAILIFDCSLEAIASCSPCSELILCVRIPIGSLSRSSTLPWDSSLRISSEQGYR